MPKQTKMKRVKFEGFLIKRRGWSTLWSVEVFQGKDYAKKYFDDYCKNMGFDFQWTDYEVIPCTITYKLTKTKK